MKKILIGTGLLLTVVSLFLWAADPMEEINRGIGYHERAQTEPEGNIERGQEILRPYINEYPLAKGYYGSLITLEAGAYAKRNNVLRAMALLDEGTSLIDEAVRSAPTLAELRVLRMVNSYALSNQSPLDRYGIMKTDIDWLEANRNLLDAKLRGLLELYKGLYYLKNSRINNAITAFEACITVSPRSPEAREAERQLKRYGE